MEAHHSRVNIPSSILTARIIFLWYVSSFSTSQWAILNIFSWHYLSSILFVDMANFSNLKILDLSENYFIGCIPQYIGALSSLKAISLHSNRLNGTLAIRGKNLQWNRIWQFVNLLKLNRSVKTRKSERLI